MEQSFILKYYGHYDLFEQDQMPAEERNWNVERIIKELNASNDSKSGPPPIK
jgi:hypothetical protein